VLDRDSFSELPKGSQLDLVDAIAPCVPLRQPRFVQAIHELELIEFAAGEAPHLNQ
jgi:hypothetical protein